MNRCVRIVGTNEAAVTARPPHVLSGPASAAAKTSAGQCQTYHAYDTRPTKRTGRSPSARVGAAGTADAPAATSAAAPSAGTSAGSAGTPVPAPNVAVAKPIAAAPPHAAAAAARRPGRWAGSHSASRPPRPSSHARAAVEKYAWSGAAPTRCTAYSSDATTIALERRADPAPPHREQQQRPHEVELLLHGERPEVVERAVRGARREVVDGLSRQLPVHRVDAGRGDVVERGVGLQRREHEPREQRDGDDRGERLRHQPLHPPRIEARERHAARAVELAHEQPRDQVARDDEEDVDPDVAAAGEADPRVGDQDDADREGPQTLDVSAELGHAATLPARAASAHHTIG